MLFFGFDTFFQPFDTFFQPFDTRALNANLYPVGGIYMAVNDTDPVLLFGGTWERIEGRFLLAASEEYEAGSTGGEATHKLTVEEIPSHNHYFKASWASSGSSVTASNTNISSSNTSINTSFTGGDQPHNNLPPYLVVYMLVRTA